ncbi:unnamed protein product [Bursaphelenchus okinawaensis]|uniref:Glycolipid transfer protein domain-containing protein n=1 Tax=Bursaphelenchus okinawaensis TaxID=465554 RepID=A0A811KID7_9BILA|nr:unnamed protein product [Bursaphelenchus okinawaensis]CAG9103558.1 unnamed protein product [Bursaphelenchus okinawaensis]
MSEPETYFSAKERLFPHLEDGKIPTAEFVSACQGIGEFVAFLGTAFIPVKNDVLGNVNKVRTMYQKDPEKYKYLQDMVEDDLQQNAGRMGIPTEGLLWLKRGLEFMLEMLLGLVAAYNRKEKSDSLYTLLSESYQKTLKHHHNFISRQLFKVVLAAAPSRHTLLKTVAYGKEGYDEYCIQHMDEHIKNFKLNVHSLVNFYTAKGLDRCYFESQ